MSPSSRGPLCRSGFVHVERHIISKLEEKAWAGVLVGYNSESPTYRFYNRQTGRVVSSRNVTFIEQAARHISTDAQATWARSNGDDDDISNFQTMSKKQTTIILAMMYTTGSHNWRTHLLNVLHPCNFVLQVAWIKTHLSH